MTLGYEILKAWGCSSAGKLALWVDFFLLILRTGALYPSFSTTPPVFCSRPPGICYLPAFLISLVLIWCLVLIAAPCDSSQ